MKKAPPEKISQELVTFKAEELEPILSPDPMNIPQFEPAAIKVKTGQTMVIRPLKKDEAPMLLNYLKKIMEVDHDFYDIVGVRVYAEILGWMRNRLKDPYQMVGLIDGHLVGFCNGRLMNEDVSISLHTMAYRRGIRAGAILYYAKAEYVFDVLKQKEFWSTFESYNGLKRWGIGMAQPSYPWPDVQHELGGAKVYYITKKYWDTTVKRYLQDMIQSKLERPVSKELLKKNENMIVPEKLEED